MPSTILAGARRSDAQTNVSMESCLVAGGIKNDVDFPVSSRTFTTHTQRRHANKQSSACRLPAVFHIDPEKALGSPQISSLLTHPAHQRSMCSGSGDLHIYRKYTESYHASCIWSVEVSPKRSRCDFECLLSRGVLWYVPRHF